MAGHTAKRTITFKLGPLQKKHSLSLSCSIGPVTVGSTGGRLLPELGRRLPFHALHGCEAGPLEAHFQSREQPNVSGIEIRRVRRLGDDATGNVWLGALS
jgi:hypothetical protein